jgi:hypothetical protein
LDLGPWIFLRFEIWDLKFDPNKEVCMKKLCTMFTVLVTATLLIAAMAMAAETVAFEPVRAPAMGPENAPVTIIEIADFM